MAFKLKSGNKTNFKSMGSSPAKHVDDVKTGTNRDKGHADAHNKRHTEGDTHGEIGSKDNKWIKKESPTKQRLAKGGEGQDQDKILDAKGNHIGNWVGDKKVMFTQEQIEDAKGVTTNINMPKVHVDPPKHKTHGAGDTGNWEPHQFRTKKKKSPAKQTATTFADGSKKSARDMFNDQETAIEQRKADRKDNQKSPYWYKIDGKSVTRAQYLKYKNKPGNMEGGGKQTNNPDVYGKIANNHGRGPKTKK